MKQLLGISLIAGVIALAIIIGQRMSTDAMAVTVGVVVGVAASIPTGLLVALAARGGRRSEPPYRRADYQPTPPPPQIYVVNPGQLPGQAGVQQQIAAAPQQHTFDMSIPARRWVVIGDDDAEEEYYA